MALDTGDAVIFGLVVFVIAIAVWDYWKLARQDSWWVRAVSLILILFLCIASWYLVVNRETVKRGNIPILQKVKAALNR